MRNDKKKEFKDQIDKFIEKFMKFSEQKTWQKAREYIEKLKNELIEFPDFLSDDATGNVTLSINGENYTGAVENGQAVFNVSGLAKGTYNITAYYSGDKKYLPGSNNSDITVNNVEH